MKVDLKKATILIKDGSTNSVEVSVGDGNLTYKETKARTYELDKGKLDTVRDGDEAPVDVTLDFKWDWLKSLTGAPTVTPFEALKKTGGAAAWISSSSDDCEPYAVDLEITIDPGCASTGRAEVILLSDFRYEDLNFDLKAGQVACTGKCNITEATVTPTTITS